MYTVRLSSYPQPDTQQGISPYLKTYVDDAVSRAVTRALRDPVGRRDFALYADGGRAITPLTGFFSGGVFIARASHDEHPPNVTLTDDLRIGQCWSIAASAGQLGVRLPEIIHITHITIDHIPFEIAADISTAPRMMILWGAIDGPHNEALSRNISHTSDIGTLRDRTGPPVTAGQSFVPLAVFNYDICASSHIQTFALKPHIVDLRMHFGVVVIEVVSNWGGKMTCLYRIRIHGESKS